MHEVRDASRILRFDGQLLASSSSRRPGKDRWIEFNLYLTENRSYVLERLGRSLTFHGAACPLVKKYGLKEAQAASLDSDALPCRECRPTHAAGLVFPEKDRPWAQVSENPAAVLSALYKHDDDGARYLTYVAQRLLDQASEKDSGIAGVYREEYIS